MHAVSNNLQPGWHPLSRSPRFHFPRRAPIALPDASTSAIYTRPHRTSSSSSQATARSLAARAEVASQSASEKSGSFSFWIRSSANVQVQRTYTYTRTPIGARNSCEATAAAPGHTSVEASVVLADGALRRFPGGTRASQAVKAAAGTGGAPAGAWFLCGADGLELGGAVAAVGVDEELQPGQLYFVLPAAMRRRPLQAEEMAALAVRASAALVGGHDDGPLVFPEAPAATVGGEGAAVPRSGKGCRRSRRGGSRGRDFVPDLGAIAE